MRKEKLTKVCWFFTIVTCLKVTAPLLTLSLLVPQAVIQAIKPEVTTIRIQESSWYHWDLSTLLK